MHAMHLLIAALFFALACLFMWMKWMHLREQERDCQMSRRVDAALATQHAAHREELGAMTSKVYAALAALTERHEALQHEMDAIKGEVFEALTYLRNERNGRNFEAGMREMQHGLRAPDENVLQRGGGQRPADHPKALVAAPRSRRTADAADGLAPSTDIRSSCTLQVDRHALESRCSSANKRPVAPAEAAAQRTFCRDDDPRHTEQAGPRTAPRPAAGSSHNRHARVGPMPTPVPGISPGGAACTRREARGSQSTAPALPQSFAGTAGARVSNFYEEAGSAVVRAAAHSEGEAPVTRRNPRAASGSVRTAECPSPLRRSGSDPISRTPADAPAQNKFSVSAPMLPVARAQRRGEKEVRTSTQDLKRRGQHAQEPQRCYPPLSALLNGIEHKRPAAPTLKKAAPTKAAPSRGTRVLSSGSLFYADVVRRHVRELARANVRD
jgi:hypothetical protein